MCVCRTGEGGGREGRGEREGRKEERICVYNNFNYTGLFTLNDYEIKLGFLVSWPISTPYTIVLN